MKDTYGWWRELLNRLMSTKLGWILKKFWCKWFGHTWYYNYMGNKYCPRCQKVVGGKDDKVHGKQKKGGAL